MFCVLTFEHYYFCVDCNSDWNTPSYKCADSHENQWWMVEKEFFKVGFFKVQLRRSKVSSVLVMFVY